MHPDTAAYHAQLPESPRALCEGLAQAISAQLPGAENKVWHRHPVWFLAGNPIVGYSRQKPGIRLMFWSGADFDEPALNVRGAKFKDASVFFKAWSEVDPEALRRWLHKAARIQWDYKSLVRRKGRLERLPTPEPF